MTGREALAAAPPAAPGAGLAGDLSGDPVGDPVGDQAGEPAGDRASGAAAVDAADWARHLADLRERGAARHDPVRWAYIEALARRAPGHQGAVRQMLDGTLARALAACAQALAALPAGENLTGPSSRPHAAAATAAAASGSSAHAGPSAPLPPGPLASLLARLARPASPGSGAAGTAPVDDLKAVRQHRRTWARLRLDRQLAQAGAAVPAQAGPLNTERLLHQALAAMREASPEYLQRWVGHAETLLRLDALAPPATAPPKKPRSAAAARRR